MPLKFFPSLAENDLTTRLALVYTLQHKNDAILQTCTAKRASAAPLRRRELFCSQFFLKKAGLETVVEITPPRPQVTLRDFSQGTTAAMMQPELPSSLHFFAERPTKLFFSLLLFYHDLPLVFLQTSHRGVEKLRTRMANWSLREFARQNTCNTWEEKIGAFNTAWAATVSVETHLPALPPPLSLLPCSFSLLFDPLSPTVLSQNPCESSHDIQSKLHMGSMEPVFALCPPPHVRPRRCVSPYPAFVSLPDIMNSCHSYDKCFAMCPALLAQKNTMCCRFLSTRGLAGLTRTLSPPMFAPKSSVDIPVIDDAASGRGFLDFACVASAPVSLRSELPGHVRQRRRSHYSDALTLPKYKQNEGGGLSVSTMMNACELRFPSGKNVRQTLTLRNISNERLRRLCVDHQRPRHHHQRLFKKLRFNVFPIARCRGLVDESVSPAAALFASCRPLPPHSLKRGKRRREDDVLSPPPLLLLLLPTVSGAAVFASSSWRALAQEDEDYEKGDDYCEGVNFAVCPRRVFSREDELQSFSQLWERGVRVLRDVANRKYEEEKEEDEEWCQEAFLHDLHTMAWPYREMDAIIDDAKLHYYYRLALCRVRRRLGI